MVRRAAACLFAALMLLAPLTAHAGAQGDEIAIEQVRTELPVTRVYFSYSGDPADLEGLRATLNRKELELVSVASCKEESEGVDLYFLIDCSTSTRAAQLQAVKDGIADIAAGINAADDVAVISFGLSAEVVSEGKGDYIAAIDDLRADQRGTVFFDALALAIDHAQKNGDPLRRRMAFVFSDSVDVNLGGYTKEEINNLLGASSMPFYALGFDTGDKAGLDEFGAIARASGGAIRVVSDRTLSDNLTELYGARDAMYVAEFRAGSNVIDDSIMDFTLSLPDKGVSVDQKVSVRDWMPDSEPPTVLSVGQATDGSIRVAFSEDVQGANLPESYVVRDANGDLLGVRAAAYDAGEHAATLTLAEIPPSGELTVEFPGISDVSMESNPVAGAHPLDFSGATPTPAPTAAPTPEAVIVEREVPQEGVPAAAWAVITIAGVAIVAGIVIAVIKKRGGLVVKDDKVHFAGSVEVEQKIADGPEVQVHFVAAELPKIRLDVTTFTGESRSVEVPVNKTLFVGRSEICDIYFDDTDMSRQHFVIEESNGAYSIANLSDTNGTLLNGVPVRQPRPLYDGDRIEAGRETFVFHTGGAV